MSPNPRAEMLFGALVADAAALGVHWIYDPQRLTDIAAANDGNTAFTPIDAAHYEGVPSYFAHSARQDGDLTQYGECLRIAIVAMIADGGQFDVTSQQDAFVAHFGPGGSYTGYIDRPTRGALQNIVQETSPTGIDDDQLPALTRLPAILAARSDDDTAAMEITNVNVIAAQYSAAFKTLLTEILSGADLTTALSHAADTAHSDIRSALQDALSTTETSSTDYAEKTGRACHLPMAGPLIFHILRHADNFSDAVERNNRAGGDNAGRSLMIGSAMGAVHGVARDTGIPLSWALKLRDGDQIWTACQTLAAMSRT